MACYFHRDILNAVLHGRRAKILDGTRQTQSDKEGRYIYGPADFAGTVKPETWGEGAPVPVLMALTAAK